MNKAIKFSLFIAILIGFSNLTLAQKSYGGINLMIKTGSFSDFYGPDDYANIYDLAKSDSQKQARDLQYKGVNSSGAYLTVFYEIEVAENITVSPLVGADTGFDWFNIGARADYYFDSLIPNLPEKLDLWGGMDAGIILGLDGDSFMVNGHAGGEWHFSENWGAIVEGGFGKIGSSFGGGIAYHF